MKYSLFILLIFQYNIHFGQSHSVARQWNELLLEGIRNDYARPPVHARNLFHVSAAMYDSWAVYDKSDTYFLGKTIKDFTIPYTEPHFLIENSSAAQEETLSYAVFRLINHRFRFSPSARYTLGLARNLMIKLGYDIHFHSIDYKTGSPAALGNYLAKKIIEFGLQDGSREKYGYGNQHYLPVNPPLKVDQGGTQGLVDPNRWQPLSFETFIDQSGNEISGSTPEFLGAEWGAVSPFSLSPINLTEFTRKEITHRVYYDPGPPYYLDTSENSSSTEFQWSFTLVLLWSSHLDITDDIVWDISPGSTGNLNLEKLPQSFDEYRDFYKTEGGGLGLGYDLNPKTGKPYEKQLVKRGDYTRVLAEFWADGPDSETPPGHWYTILNYVSDHPDVVKKIGGKGVILNDLEWDVKTYFALGGAMHDAAIAAWGIKGFYDYIRPISALRYMAEQGQSSDSTLPNYSATGLPLITNQIEVIKEGDSLIGKNSMNLGKIKVYAWKGHKFISDPSMDVAGVGWILAEDWMPYQRSTFVTPPFSGYVSGHSTYSRAAAEILTLLTGDEYFPGGIGEFAAQENKFLKFEKGPSTNLILQWAKYYDAADQCSLSRIWGGIHPPIDDIPGRLIGAKIGKSAFQFSYELFKGNGTTTDNIGVSLKAPSKMEN